jgi:ABC-2 type transport system ATP-binding protein
MIVAEHLSKTFGKLVAVDSINFRIPRGRVVGFLGPNGAGKTTTIRMIAGFLKPTGGTIAVDGVDVSRQPKEARRGIGYLPEATPLYTEMRVSEYLHFRARLFGVPRSRRRAAVDRALRRCWLEDVRRRPIGQLSKGYRQRVGLASTLIHEPPLLVAGQHTILLSTHILAEGELACDDIIIMAGGRVQTQGTLEDLRASAARECHYVVETDDAGAEATVRALDAVASVEAKPLEGAWQRLRVMPRKGADDLRPRLGEALAGGGGHLRELRREATTLEHLFMELVAGAAPDRERAGEKAGTP